MAKITFTIDTEAKTITGSVDGTELPTLDNISASKNYDGSMYICCGCCDDSGPMSSTTTYYYKPEASLDDSEMAAMASLGFRKESQKPSRLASFLRKKMAQ